MRGRENVSKLLMAEGWTYEYEENGYIYKTVTATHKLKLNKFGFMHLVRCKDKWELQNSGLYLSTTLVEFSNMLDNIYKER